VMSFFAASLEVYFACTFLQVISQLLLEMCTGERHRVTTAEMVCTVTQVGILDSISTGLDSASTFDIVKTAQEATKYLNRTTVISLLQPPPEVCPSGLGCGI
jgi:ABC-type cobalamin/Fe3+-siderophores transport system ATPase subunit